MIIVFADNFCFSQRDILGVYENSMWRLQLDKDSTYRFDKNNNIETGEFKMSGDTIITISDIDGLSKKVFRFYDINDTTIKPKINSEIIKILKKDSIFDNYYIQHERFFNPYFKTIKYYDSGQIKYEVKKKDRFVVIIHYFENGKISAIKTFENEYKTGQWYYFDINGNLVKIEKYKRDKLKNGS